MLRRNVISPGQPQSPHTRYSEVPGIPKGVKQGEGFARRWFTPYRVAAIGALVISGILAATCYQVEQGRKEIQEFLEPRSGQIQSDLELTFQDELTRPIENAQPIYQAGVQK